jgi:hypothetical protein
MNLKARELQDGTKRRVVVRSSTGISPSMISTRRIAATPALDALATTRPALALHEQAWARHGRSH